MRDFDNLYEKVLRLKTVIQNDRPRIALRGALGLNARIQLRLTEKGEDSNANFFRPYSAFSRTERTRKGYQVAYVDFTQTGAMLNNTQPRIVEDSANQTIVQIAPNRASEVRKFKNNDRLRKDFYKPSRSEIQAMTVDIEAQFTNLIKIGL